MAVTWRMGEMVFHILADGTLQADGGAFFGVVPKARWRRLQPVDEDNTFPLPVRPLLVETAGKRLLVETGMGDKHARAGKFARSWGIRQPVTLAQELAAVGVAPEDIDLVILTHLHFDHCGGNTRRDAGGRIVPTFPRARYLVQRREYAEARYPGALARDSYFAEDVVPVEEAGLWDLLEGDTEIAPGVSVEVVPGHLPALQIVRFESAGQVALAVTDLVPSLLHARPAWNSAYDLDPVTNALGKQRILARAARGGWHLFFYHDPRVLLARAEPEGTLRPVLEEAVARG